jgi:hypothetical protein
MNDGLSKLLTRALNQPTVPATLLRTAYQRATAEKDLDTQVVIIARPDCPADLVDDARRSTQALLRGAYLGRPGPVDDTRRQALKTEKATSALEHAAAQAGLPDEIVDALISDARPLVLATLTYNQTLTAGHRRAALHALDRTFTRLSYTGVQKVTSLTNRGIGIPEGDTPFVITDERLALILLAHPTVLPTADRHATVAHWAPILFTRDPDAQGPLAPHVTREVTRLTPAVQDQLAAAHPSNTGLLTHLVFTHLTDETLALVTPALTDHLDHRGVHTADAANLLGRHAERIATRPHGAALLAGLLHNPLFTDATFTYRGELGKALAGTGHAAVAAASGTPAGAVVTMMTSTDQAELLNLTLQAVKDRTLICEALLTNPHAPAAAGRLLLAGDYPAAPVVTRFPDDPAVLGLAVLRLSGMEVTRHLTRLTEHPHGRAAAAVAVNTMLVTLDPTDAVKDTKHCLDMFHRLDNAGLLDPDTLATIDAALRRFPAAPVALGSAHDFVYRRLLTVLDELFTARPGTAEVFTALLPEWDTSLGDLLDAAQLTTG